MGRLLIAMVVARAWGADCSACHREIYNRYRLTPMALTSGVAGKGAPRESFEKATFRHAASGFRYRVTPYSVAFDNGKLHGEQPLRYFVGSGATARSYLIESGGFLYQAPVAYYSGAARWDLAPGYQTYGYPFLTRPILPGCLTCHASNLDVDAATQNRYGEPPFREPGISCERCHGTGDHPHLVNPAKLPPDRRDSVCAQCHLSGEARVMRKGTDWNSFRPGARLSDSVTAFVRAGNPAGMTVTGHVEKLAQSACARKSGDRLWCGTCHDPHSTPAPAARSLSYRQKCEGCHPPGACTANRGNDCIACHMPKSPVTDAQHVVYTDHSIPRRPRAAIAVSAAAKSELVRFGGGTATSRDLGLAYAIAGDPARARPLLEAAERSDPEDVEVLVYLAEIYRTNQEGARAEPLYRRALRLSPSQVSAEVGLGAVLMERGASAEAIRLWEDAASRNPGLVLMRTNLAMAQWGAGNRQGAEGTLRQVIALSPGFQPAADLLKRLQQ